MSKALELQKLSLPSEFVNKIERISKQNKNKDSLVRDLVASERKYLFLIFFELNFNFKPIQRFLGRCQRLYELRPDLPINQIIELASFSLGTNKEPDYSLEYPPTEKQKKEKKKLLGKTIDYGKLT